MEQIAKESVNQTPNSETNQQIQAFQNGAKWFYWIAGLSLVNTLLSLFGAGIVFVIGLGITQLADGIAAAAAQEYPNTSMIFHTIAILFNASIAGIYVLFGYFALKMQSWAFIVGMILFSLDSLLSVLIQDWIGFGFHIFALIFIFKGYTAMKNVRLGQTVTSQEPIYEYEREIS